MAVSFFCTRCRSLLQFPETSCGSIVYCPKCRQAVIVPIMSVTESEGEPNPAVIPDPISTSSDDRGPRTIPVIRHLDENAGERLYSFGIDPDLMITPEPVSDDEFLERVQATPNTIPVPLAAPAPNVAMPPPPPVLEASPVAGAKDEFDEARADSLSGPYLLAVTLAVFFAIGVAVWFVYHLFPEKFTGTPPNRQEVEARADPVAIDGKAIYYSTDGRAHGDEGAIAILIPVPCPIKEPLVIGTLAPDKPTPIDFEPHRRQLESLGGCFGRATSDGFIDLKIQRPGTYKILFVSANVTRIPDAIEQKKIAEISQYLFHPDQTLLSGYAFFWDEKQLDAQNYRVEYNFGKKD